VHEAPDCVEDLLDNLQFLDPESIVLLYDGSGGSLALPERPGALVHPEPRAMKWGKLHEFALDCMRFALERMEFDTLTIVDSDQLAIRAGYSRFVATFLAQHPDAGCLVSAAGVQPRTTRVGPPQAAWREFELWRPFLRRFPGGEDMFPHWTFWPSTVFTRRAAEDLLALWADEELQGILARTEIWASEEVLLPSLVALLGHRVLSNPCTYDLVQYRAAYTVAQLNEAMDCPSAFWVHPVPRVYGDPLRSYVRSRFGTYLPASVPAADPFEAPEARPLPLLLPLIKYMEDVEGWLSQGEADLLAATAARALSQLAAQGAIVEVGSYCGRATVVLGAMAKAVSNGSSVYAIDPHDGKLGARGEIVAGLADSSTRLLRHIEEAGLSGVVRHIRAYSGEVSWDTPIRLLVIDHLHDYASVAADFSALQRFVVDGGLVAFHDYGRFPGVTAFVGDLLATGAYASVQRVETLVVVRKAGSLALAALGGIVGQNDGRPEESSEVDRDEAALLALVATRALAACSADGIVEAGSPGPREHLALAAAAAAAGRPGPIICAPPGDVAHTPGRLCLLVVGGGQEPGSAAAGLRRFQNQVAEGGFVAVRECSDLQPAAVAAVREALGSGAFEQAARIGSLMVLRKCVLHQAGDARDGATAGAVRREGPTRRGASDEPLVSCLMPTFDRRPFVPRAIRYFLQQDYPRSELIIVDDGTDNVEDLVPADPRIRYLRLPERRTIGAKRNLACEHARGELVVHWDDDDWSAPWRLRYQVDMLRAQGVDVSGLSAVFFCDVSAAQAWRYEYPAGRRRWVHDATFCYRRSLWAAAPFPDTNYGIDTSYLWQGAPKQVGTLPDPSFYVGLVHAGNSSRKDVHNAWWHPHPIGEIASLMGSDWETYQKAE
jgi:Glycosyl transferase family 2/Methyltransferase domain